MSNEKLDAEMAAEVMHTEPGDVVWLKSGGPKMIVAKKEPFINFSPGFVPCIWFNEVGEIQRADICEKCLTSTNPNPEFY